MAASTAAAQGAWPYYRIVDLGVVPDGTTSEALAVNADGTVIVGQSKVGTKTLPFIWRNGAMELLGNAAVMKGGTARGVNGPFADGIEYKVVGEYTDAATSKKHAFVYDTEAGFRDLPKPVGHLEATAWDVNESGQIVGYTTFDPPSAFRNQPVPVRWDEDAQPPSLLYTGPMLNYNTTNCVYTGRGFSMTNPIRMNDAAPTPHVVTTWRVNVDNDCIQLPGDTVATIITSVAVKNVLGTPALASWKGAASPPIARYRYWSNQKYLDWTNSFGSDINNVGTVIDYGRVISNRPGLPMFNIVSFAWLPTAPADTYRPYAGLLTCSGGGQLYEKAINDDNVMVGSTLVQYDTGTNCLDGKPYTVATVGFVHKVDGGPLKYLVDRVRADCGWKRLLPNDINNDGMIVGVGLRADGSSRAFLMLPVDSLPPNESEGCSGGSPESDNRPPVADAGADQTAEATSPAGAVVTLDGSGSSDPDDDPLTYDWNTPVGEFTGVSATVNLPIGAAIITLTVTDDEGASDSDSVTATVEDTTPPDTIITAAPPAMTNSGAPAFSFTGSDIATALEALEFQCSLDGSPWTSCTSPASYSDLADGAHHFAVRAVDGVGIWDPTPATYDWDQDATPPSITISSPPDGGTLLIAASAAASYSCADDGSGVETCTGTAANGSALDTFTPGSFVFKVDASDKAGNTASLSHVYTVAYGICGYDPFGARRSGSVIPVKIEACDSSGLNLSRPTLPVTAVDVLQVSSGVIAPALDAGRSNPGSLFRFDGGRYLFNLDTDGFVDGTYRLRFVIGSDPTLHAVEFEIRSN
jgi:hypothetical protein